MMPTTITIPKILLTILNNVYEIEKKAHAKDDPIHILRNVEKIKDAISEEGLVLEDPYGQPFKDTRNDIEASISGDKTSNLHVVEVLKLDFTRLDRHSIMSKTEWRKRHEGHEISG